MATSESTTANPTSSNGTGRAYVPQFDEAYKGGGLYAVRDLLLEFQENEGIRLLEDVPRRNLYSVKQLGTFPQPEWLKPGEVPAHAFSMLVGPSGGGKSFESVDLAFSIARDTKRKVVYLAAEGASGYYDRAFAWCKHHKYSGDGVLFDIQPLELRTPSAVQVFIETIKPLNPALVIIDTLARCMLGLDENSARDMGLAVEACATIIRETGAAVLIVHHTGKSGVGERGSSALYAACDNVLSLSNDDGLITISCAKSKDSKPFAERYVRLVEVETADGRSSCVTVPSDRVITRGAPLTVTQKKVLEILAIEAFLVTGAKAQSLQNQVGASERGIYRTLSSLMRDGYIRQATKGDPYFIEDKGLAALQLPPLPTTANVSPVSRTPTELTATATTLKGGSTVSSASSANGEENETKPMPYLNDLIAPLRGSNGKGGKH